ncbi:MAG: PAS domain-containing protein [Spirochaetaceae bacterium]
MHENHAGFVRRWMDRVLESSDLAWWEWDVTRNEVKIGPKKATMLGYDPADFQGGGYQAFTDLLHPEDYERAMEAMRRLLSGRSPIYQIDYRIKAADGAYRWYMDRGTFVEGGPRTEEKRTRGVVIDLGAAFDVSASDAAGVERVRPIVAAITVPRTTVTLCAVCGRLRTGEHAGVWHEITAELVETLEVEISHGICPDCIRTLYPEYADEVIAAVGGERPSGP